MDAVLLVAGVDGADLHCDGVYAKRESAGLPTSRPREAHPLHRARRHCGAGGSRGSYKWFKGVA